MQLNRFTDYSLRVLIYLGQKNGQLATIHEISQSYAISEAHLMKVVHHLGKCGYLATLRGKGGGLRLARPPGQINLGEVVRHTEETLCVVECLKEHYAGQCRLYGACKLTGVLRGAQALFLGHLDRFTVADLLQAPLPASPATAVATLHFAEPVRRTG